ncbi:unnamed protein product [Mycena citricolor]|uniref:Uncharacterized protein n=1 Tax=Mycena citricolor TaxID=2018698 RepID=A0AAD2HEX9_9AGAR|nr:unnamed protein product [Mycena citricolor]CAK5273676.1 unnamed protein product [Mycena citricolor]
MKRPSNLQIALAMNNLNSNSSTRPCTQCRRPVPQTQTLLTCEQCREKTKRKKARRKERAAAVEAGRDSREGGLALFDSKPLEAVIKRQEEETAAVRRADAAAKQTVKKGAQDAPSARTSSSKADLSSAGKMRLFQAVLEEHQGPASRRSTPAIKKTATGTRKKKMAGGLFDGYEGREFGDREYGEGGGPFNDAAMRMLFDMMICNAFGGPASSSSQIAPAAMGSKPSKKRKLEEVEVIDYEEMRKKRLRGDFPMPPLEPINAQSGSPPSLVTSTSPEEEAKEPSTPAKSTRQGAGKQTTLAGWLKKPTK